MTAVDDSAAARDAERPSPWPGLASFREEDQGCFHGRGAEIEELFGRVERERLTVVYGISGLGKTSLLRAGLFPRLRQVERLPVYLRLDHADEAPAPAGQVRRAIAAEAGLRGVTLPALDHDSLWETFHRADAELWGPRNELLTPVLVFDQFEEIFTLGRRDAAARHRADAFLAELADLVEGRAPLAFLERLEREPELGRDFAFRRHDYKVVISLREEFLPEIEGLRELMPALAQNRFRLCRMSGASAREAVRRAGGDLVAPGVAEEVVRFVAAERAGERADLADLEVEPALLSVVCRELDNQRRHLCQAQITSDLLAGGREEILSDLYERGFADIPPPARAFVEERLLTVSGFRDSVAWDNALETPGVAAQDLQKLVERRLLRIEESGRGKRVELIHDLLTGVAAASRDRRRLEEELAAEQQRQREAHERRRQAEKLRRTRRMMAAISAFALIALVAMAIAFWQRDQAKEARLAAQKAVIRSANLLIEEDKVVEGVAYLAQALKSDPQSWQARSLLFDILLRRTWPLIATVVRHEGAVLAARLSPDEQQILTASAAGTVTLWNAGTGAVLNQPIHGAGDVAAAHFNRDGSRVVLIVSGAAELWDVSTGEYLGELKDHEGEYEDADARFNPDGEQIITASFDNSARLWNVESRQLVRTLKGHAGWVLAARFSRDGNRVVTASADMTARVWETATGTLQRELKGHADRVLGASFSPDGKRVVTASADNTGRLWDVDNGQSSVELKGHDDWVVDARFSSDGSYVVTASDDRTARLWDAKTGQPLGEPMRHEGKVFSAAFSPDGKYVVTASADGTARSWLAATAPPRGEPLGSAEEGGAREVNRSLGIADDGTLQLTAAGAEARLYVLKGHRDAVKSAWLSPDGRRIVTAFNNKTARLWDAETGLPLGELMRHESWINTAQFDPDGRRVVTASEDRTARLWDAETGQPLGEPMRHESDVKTAAFTADGRSVVTTSADGTIRKWATPVGSAADSLLLARLAEAVVGYHVNDLGVIVPVADPTRELQRLRREVERKGAESRAMGVWERICWRFSRENSDPAPPRRRRVRTAHRAAAEPRIPEGRAVLAKKVRDAHPWDGARCAPYTVRGAHPTVARLSSPRGT